MTIWKHFIKSLPLTLLLMVLTAVVVLAAAGMTDSPSAPGSTSSYTLEDLYQRLAKRPRRKMPTCWRGILWMGWKSLG